MRFFDNYVSNTLAGSANQSFFCPEDKNKVNVSRVYYKVFAGGDYNYSILFTNMIDSTYSDGRYSRCNMIMDEWTIVSARVGVCKHCDAVIASEPREMMALTFDQNAGKQVSPGEFFACDPIKLSAEKNEYICLEVSFCGKQIPNHPESILPCFVFENDTWVASKNCVFAAMIGCDRAVEGRIGFIGDSITQGIGVEVNSYDHWNAVFADIIGEKFAYWNLGIGYGREHDAATDGAWAYKARQNDLVIVCFGVNDIGQGYSTEEIKRALAKIVRRLKTEGKRVVLQTVPPFDYVGKTIDIWNDVNRYIKDKLATEVDFVFDAADCLKKSDAEPYLTIYGLHPDNHGCKIWGTRFAKEMRSLYGYFKDR